MSLTALALDNAEQDCESLSDIVNGSSTAPDVVTRLGRTVKPVAKVIEEIAASISGTVGYEPPVAYANGLNIIRATQTVTSGGEVYAPATGLVPFVTGAVFDPSQWRLVLAKNLVSRAEMKALGVVADGTILLLVDAFKTGVFRFTTANVKTLCDADPTEGLRIKPTGGDGTTGAWERLVEGQHISRWWGVTTVGGAGAAAANTAAYNAANTALAALNPGAFGYVKGGSRLYTPEGHYYFNGSLSPESAVDNFGDSTGFGNGTIFQWTSKVCHGFNLKGFDGADNHASGSKVHGFHLIGAYAAPGDRGNFHGVYVNGGAEVYDLFGEFWPGNLVYGFGDTTTHNGNINGSKFRNIFGQFCDWVLFLDGSDANGCVSSTIQGTANRFGTYFDRSFLGSSLYGGLSESNNQDVNFLSKCHVGGHIYVVRYGQEAFCAANAPTGAKTNNTGWLYWFDAGPTALQPTWTAGQTWYFSAPFAMHPGDGNIRGAIYGVYIEDSENPPVISFRCTFLPAANTRPVWSDNGTPAGGTMHGNGGAMEFPGSILVDGAVVALGTAHAIGPQVDFFSPVADNSVIFYATNFSTFMPFVSYGLSGGVTPNTDAQINGGLNALSLSGKSALRLQLNGTTKWQLDGTGFYPLDDNVQPIGGASNRASVIYAGTGAINTSDKRHKEQIGPVDDAILDAWGKVQWEQFKFKEAVAAKKDGARLHVGLVAQHVRDVFKAAKIDGFALGLLCFDKWESAYEPEDPEEVKYVEQVPVPLPRQVLKSGKLSSPKFKMVDRVSIGLRHRMDDGGKPLMKIVRQTGDAFGVRYTEALALEAAYQRRRGDRMEGRLAAVERKLGIAA